MEPIGFINLVSPNGLTVFQYFRRVRSKTEPDVVVQDLVSFSV
jgi:hypothetical protein